MRRKSGKFFRLKRILTAPRRAARRKGFGIHSPFAFDFVRRVIAQPYAYYAYESLLHIASGRRQRYLKLLFRLALYFRPESISVAGVLDDAETKALTLGCGSLKIADYADFILIKWPSEKPADLLERCAGRGGTIVFCNIPGRDPAMLESFWLGTDHGMLFRGGSIAIYVGLKHLPHQRFDVWI